MTLLSLEGVEKRFHRGLMAHPDRHPAVDGADLTVQPGQNVGLIGESGSGKTTLARLALGLLTPDRGRVRLLGSDISELKAGDLRSLRRRAQLLFQHPAAALNPGLRVQEMLEDSVRLHHPEQEPQGPVKSVLETVSLTHRAQAWAHQLSGGEQRRVGLARALLADPDLLVADEPSAGLDAVLKVDLVDLLLERRNERRGLLLISHDLPLVAYACESIHVMLAGRIVERFPVSRLGSGPHHPYTRALLQAAGLSEDEHLPDPSNARGRSATGCVYRGACPMEVPTCTTHHPPSVSIDDEHHVVCSQVTP